MIRRTSREKLLAWIVTGPLGHLYGTLADLTALWTRWGVSRIRARARRSR
jgi:hypothetical protein